MKILLVGTFLKGYLDASYERHLKACGCNVFRLDTAAIIKDSTWQFFSKHSFSRRLFKRKWEELINKKLMKDFQDINPDLIIVFKGYYLWPSTIKKISAAKKSLTFCFNGDDPFNLASSGASNNNILNTIPYYDCYLIWTRSLIEPLLKAGAKRAEYLPFGFDPLLYSPLELSSQEKQKYNSDIVFIGNWDDERERWLKGLKDFDLAIWGEGYWGKRCQDKELRLKWQRRAMYEQDMLRVLAGAKISLNILRKQNKGNYNMRTFEAPACGAFVLAERSHEAVEFFADNKEAAYFSTPEELKEKARYYLNHEDERLWIAKAGYERCICSGYSYFERAKKILSIYDDLKR
jgi:spore maturation protein CgeB